VLEQMKSALRGDLKLELLHGLVLKLKDAFALGANHVVMVLAQMMVLIAGLAVIEQVFPGKPVMAHQFDGITDKLELQACALGIHQDVQFLSRHMMFGGQKNFQHGQPILEPIDSILLEKLYELLFFLLVNRLRSHE
jgi:hypothetical protein